MARAQVGTVFTGTERLLERPLPGDWGLAATADGLRVTRALSGGQLPVDGTRTSQLLSGLLMALPGLAADSELALTGPLASRPYVDLTLAVLRRCGVHIGQTDCGFTIPGGQRFRTVPLDPEPDWSAAAYWLAVRALGCAVAVTACAGTPSRGPGGGGPVPLSAGGGRPDGYPGPAAAAGPAGGAAAGNENPLHRRGPAAG